VALELKAVDRVEVISLVDNSIDFLSTASLKKVQSFWQWTKARHEQSKMPVAEHGFSILVKVINDETSESFLFDTGGSPNVIIDNSKIMGLDLSQVSFVVLSHGHYDHFGGLLSIVEAVGKTGLPLIVHEDMFKARGTALRDGTIRKYPDFPTPLQLQSTQLVFTKQPFLTANKQICVTGEIPRKTSFENGLMQHQTLLNGSWEPDPTIIDDRAIVMNVKNKGLIILSGCAHAGIINTINYAKQATGIETVYAVLGGFHLAGRGFEAKIAPTLTELTRINPALIAPSHCTGWRAMVAIHQAFPDAFVCNSVGNLYQL
jgi:7,8-dihydropterin-6-yl-methyl-4-(beta-D-ribofuranosyl)aminobenzene 5'-phosphate synthase